MGESFTIQISSNLVRHLVDDDDKKLKKKTKKPKPKVPRESNQFPTFPPNKPSDDSETLKGAGRPLPPPFYLPIPPHQQAANAELDAIRSVLHESEAVVESLQKREEDMLREVTQRAKDLHEKEFKLPNNKASHCLSEKDACLKCYKENAKDPLKCGDLVKDFADCARRIRQQVGALNN